MTPNIQRTKILRNHKAIINVFNSVSLNPISNIYIIILFCFFTAISYSQIIKGIVHDENGNPLNAKLLVKNTSNPKIVSEFMLVVNGKYSYTISKKYDNDIIIQVTSIGYSSAESIINPTSAETTIELNFILFKEKIQNLDEVYIEGRKRPFDIKEDTIVYNVDSYKDGTEKKLEDLLKKLPGIDVNAETGLIKYRGREIETVMIEGDNLFDYNYTIGTKNINIDLVKEIEAIENYSENILLKGIEQSNKVALNLKLKDNKVDISGNIDFGTGFFNKKTKKPVNASTNLLGINKLYKSFNVLTYNNIGLNLSPFNNFSEHITFEQIREQDYFAQKIIPELDLMRVTNDNLSNNNDQLFGNFNSIFNISKKLKAKVNLFYINDQINSNQFSESNYTINNQAFTTFDNDFIHKTPTQYRGDLELKLITSKSSLLEYDISLRDEDIKTDRSIFSNQENDFMSVLKSTSSFLKQQLQYTNRITSKKAIQISLFQSTNSLNQNYKITPSVFELPEVNSDFQKNNSKKEYTDFKVSLLAARNNDNYSFILGGSNNNELFVSTLSSENDADTFLIEVGANDLEYKKNEVYTLGSYNWKLGKFKFTPNYSFRFLHQNLTFNENNSSIDTNVFIFEPSLNLSYRINRISSFNVVAGFNKNTNSLQYLFSNNVLINNRLIIKNMPDLTLQKNQTYGISYEKNDLYNQLEMSFGANYLKQKGNFFTNSQIDSNSITLENFFLPENTESFDFNFNFSKLIPVLKTTIKLNSFYSVYNFKNIINNSDLRNNTSNYIRNEIFLKTAFNYKVNFENTTIYNYQETKSVNLFKNASFENKFKIIFKPSKQIFGALTIDYFIPNLAIKSNDYTFIGSKIWYKPKDKSWEMSLSGTNLANIKYFEQFNTSDVSKSSYRINLLNRFVILNFSYNF